MTDQPYDVDADLGDDPQESEIAETESRMDAGDTVRGYTFQEDEDRGERGISEDVRQREDPVLEREDWGPDPDAETGAVHEEDDEGRWET